MKNGELINKNGKIYKWLNGAFVIDNPNILKNINIKGNIQPLLKIILKLEEWNQY